MSNLKIAVVMLTWQRLEKLPASLEMLSHQTNKNFTVYISNSNPDKTDVVEEAVAQYSQKLDITLKHDSNSMFSFRRLFIGKDLAEKGFDVIFFLDDDVIIPKDYIEQCLAHYEPNSYKSAYAWKFLGNETNYYRNRTRIKETVSRVHYCGTAVAVIDAKFFLNDGIFSPPREAYKIEDLWMSYYADHILKWKLGYIPVEGLTIGGNDAVALSRSVKKTKYNKAVFLIKLINLGWNLETDNV